MFLLWLMMIYWFLLTICLATLWMNSTFWWSVFHNSYYQVGSKISKLIKKNSVILRNFVYCSLMNIICRIKACLVWLSSLEFQFFSSLYSVFSIFNNNSCQNIGESLSFISIVFKNNLYFGIFQSFHLIGTWILVQDMSIDVISTWTSYWI